ncbi:uncharacterized protein N0V89_005248 [Didymosphaeria variabile]|uniref:Uncharacterized protein n=1 Tax=Didymosphaeria variabile TaxID=1932322 RepID=A0A9W8XLV3_9PLEO|nr:uncharacterized protein N0V89_005248 [Didymosphaeria variabile]KAJ4353518.1 hypothetical protein N0V89_005248 [Didymosphaeria variabile]
MGGLHPKYSCRKGLWHYGCFNREYDQSHWKAKHWTQHWEQHWSYCCRRYDPMRNKYTDMPIVFEGYYDYDSLPPSWSPVFRRDTVSRNEQLYAGLTLGQWLWMIFAMVVVMGEFES